MMLEPCPFCGEEINRYSVEMDTYGVERLQISCCMNFDITRDALLFANGEPFKFGLDAVEKWNRRAGEQDELRS